MTKENKLNSWSIGGFLVKHALSRMKCFIPDGDIKEQILQEFPTTVNLTCKKEMDSNTKSLLVEKKAKETMSLDKAFCSMQEKV